MPFGAGVGLLYSLTTISGPPLAVLFNNQGMVKEDFRAALGVIRAVESTLTAIAYYHLGLFVAEAAPLFYVTAVTVLVGLPLGAWLIRHVDADTFRRICMSFDIWIVSFGLSRVLMELKLATAPFAYAPLVACVAIDLVLLYRFLSRGRVAAGRGGGWRGTAPSPASRAPPASPPPAARGGGSGRSRGSRGRRTGR